MPEGELTDFEIIDTIRNANKKEEMMDETEFTPILKKVSPTDAENAIDKTMKFLYEQGPEFGDVNEELKVLRKLQKTSNEAVSNAKVNDTIREQISTQDNVSETNLQKRKDEIDRFFQKPNEQQSNRFVKKLRKSETTDEIIHHDDDDDEIEKEMCESAIKRIIQGLVTTTRKSLRRRGDLILRKGIHEYGASEVGKDYEDDNETKLLKERGLKSPKMLKNMLVDLGNFIMWETNKLRHLELVSFIHAGTNNNDNDDDVLEDLQEAGVHKCKNDKDLTIISNCIKTPQKKRTVNT
ncbi:hypothetical protein C1645_731555 [Glomus cerebriforme]|uniref:Uncharacterized protein n=1 Tax=Glomus cerebriforme TaxID=658196 RepID=A0A397TUT0_9GLOM|nr:hypothetical protein C1645_731555 [Glomus cerebriforme]